MRPCGACLPEYFRIADPDCANCAARRAFARLTREAVRARPAIRLLNAEISLRCILGGGEVRLDQFWKEPTLVLLEPIWVRSHVAFDGCGVRMWLHPWNRRCAVRCGEGEELPLGRMMVHATGGIDMEVANLSLTSPEAPPGPSVNFRMSQGAPR